MGAAARLPLLADLVDEAAVDAAVSQRLISVREAGPLRIFNYTPRAVYTRVWNAATLLCRGLIVDLAGRVVARPFPKFFGPSEPDAPPIPAGRPMVVTDKVDGSLGIGYHHPDGGIRVATRGSLTSDQATEGTRIWHDKYGHVRFDRTVTPLFEIVYPANRVVVDYGEQRDLVLLAVIDITSGADLPLDCFGWPGPVAEQYPFGSFTQLADSVKAGSGGGREGYVASFDLGPDVAPVRFKLKYPDYVAAHRVVTGLTARRVWEVAAVADTVARGVDPKVAAVRLKLNPDIVVGIADRRPDPIAGLRGDLPEEFWGWYDQQIFEYQTQAGRLIDEYWSLIARARTESGAASGRLFAEAAFRLAAECGLPPGPLFALNQQRADAYASIWCQLRPEGAGSRP